MSTKERDSSQVDWLVSVDQLAQGPGPELATFLSSGVRNTSLLAVTSRGGGGPRFSGVELRCHGSVTCPGSELTRTPSDSVICLDVTRPASAPGVTCLPCAFRGVICLFFVTDPSLIEVTRACAGVTCFGSFVACDALAFGRFPGCVVSGAT